MREAEEGFLSVHMKLVDELFKKAIYGVSVVFVDAPCCVHELATCKQVQSSGREECSS